MKRIIIPAGTVSGKKDYILEIPIDSNDQDENAIYILDDKMSKGSMKSLSDYFYDKNSGSQLNQEYMDQYLYDDQQEPVSSEDLPNVPQNYVLRQEYNTRNYDTPENHNPRDISQAAKYQYYKSLGFTESELFKLLARKEGRRRLPSVPLQRRQMRFNRLGVSDFTSVNDDQNAYAYQNNSFTKPINATAGTTNIGTRGNMLVDSTYSDTLKTASTSFDRYYENSLNRTPYVPPNVNSTVYKQQNSSLRSPVSSTMKNDSMTNKSYVIQQNTTQPLNAQQMQRAYYQSRYYTQPFPTVKSSNLSRTMVSQKASQIQTNSIENKTYDYPPRATSPTGKSNKVEENQQTTLNTSTGQTIEPQKRIYRTLPGTSVVSNIPDIRIRKTAAT